MALHGIYRVSFSANGGAGAPGDITGTTDWVDSGGYYFAIFSLPSTKPSRTYYTFLGWSKNSGATSASYSAGGTMSVQSASASITSTLYAVWQHQTAYVYYNANGGTGAPATQSHWAGYSVTLSATAPTRTGYNFLGWAQSATATTAQYQPNTSYSLYTTVTLYAVWQPASSVLTASNGTMGTSMTIGITRYVNTYTDTITYKFGTATGTIVTKTGNASVSWTPPTTLASEIPNASSGALVLTCTTYNGNTVVGTSSITVSLAVPQSLAPSASVSFADTDATCLGWGVYVQSRSKLSFTITASGQESATIASYRTTVNGTQYTGATFTTDVLLYNGSNTYTTVVTDSRGLQTTVTGTFNVVAYSVPSLTLTLCDRDDSDDSQINIEFDFTVASVSNNNDANYRLDYKLKSASVWTNGTVQNLGAYSGSISDLIANLDGGDEWDIRINVIDSFQTTSITSEVGVSGNILLNSRHAGGLGLLMKSQAQNQLDIGKPTVHHGAVLEQFGSTVGNHAVSGNYAKILTFGSANGGSGKNLLSPHLYSGIVYNPTVGSTVTLTDNATQMTDNGDGTFTVTTTATWRYYILVCPVSQANDYHLYIQFSSSGTGGTSIGYLDSNYTILWNTNMTDASQTKDYNLSIPTGGAYFYFLFTNRGTASTTLTITNPQIEYGTTATPYEPYGALSLNVSSPLTLEYIRTGDLSPTQLTINFATNYTLSSIKSNNSVEAYMVQSSSTTWDLYIGKSTSSDSVEILDFHNPWSNSDMTITWGNTSISTLPTGYVTAQKVNGMIQCGTASAVTISAGTYADIPVTFPVQFPSVPTVVVSLDSSSTGVGMGYVTCAVCYGTITTTGFTIRCWNKDTSDRAPAYTWIAML